MDNQPDTLDGARPVDIALGLRDELAYIADENKPEIYVLDIDPFSCCYHADWMEGMNAGNFRNAGVAEAAADSLFVSLADLDLDYGGKLGESDRLYDGNGDLIRKHGAVFNAPLHFIGFGQGAVVNTEIIQRLGTYFPDAGGFQSSDERDLHMTTVEPFEFNPESAPQFEDTLARMLDPEIVVWENVTYADNYYQVQGKQGSNSVLKGKALEKTPPRPDRPGRSDRADMNYKLGNWAGFDRAKDEDNAHRAAMAWYGGTANLNENKIPAEQQLVFRRLGDLEDLNDPNKSWYVPGHTKSSFNHGDTKAPWEGIGTGWFYSVNGGGNELRPYFVNGNRKKGKEELGDFEEYLEENRMPVTYDNTYTDNNRMMLADYSVPTLFNGNFDAIGLNESSEQKIPGWNYSNTALQKNLVQWKEIPFADYRRKVGYGSFTPKNWALKMGGGGAEPVKTITHNPFIVPDWGVLRFDLHVPADSIGNGKLKVFIQPLDSPSSSPDAEILLKKARNSTTSGTRTRLDGSTYSVRIPSSYAADRQKIGYGVDGFETFHVDVSPELRGKPAILKFELEGDNPIYLDNVFFKSDSLRWGNPTEARNDPSSQYQDNFLIEKPQYSLSYNRSKNTINWVAWKLNKSWLGNVSRPNNLGFAEDASLTSGYRVQDSDYDALYLRDAQGEAVRNENIEIDRGHLSPAGDRTRNSKDLKATFLTTNLLPQQRNNNQGVWKALEEHLRNVIKESPMSSPYLDTYMIAGGFKQDSDYSAISPNADLNPAITLPDGLWKVALTVGNNIYEPPTASHFGVYMGNARRDRWERFAINIQELESLLSSDNTIPGLEYEFLTANVSADIAQGIKSLNQIIYPTR